MAVVNPLPKEKAAPEVHETLTAEWLKRSPAGSGSVSDLSVVHPSGLFPRSP
jgi:hypothetical protein